MTTKIQKNNRIYFAEYVWSYDGDDVDDDDPSNVKQNQKNILPIPTEGNIFGDKKQIKEYMRIINEVLDILGRYENHKKRNCLICGKKNVDTKNYFFESRMWSDSIIHYIDKHNIEPSVAFKQFIYNDVFPKLIDKLTKHIKYNKMGRSSGQTLDQTPGQTPGQTQKEQKKKNFMNREKEKIILKRMIIDNKEYVKFERNNILVIDSLMNSGGKYKKYIDTQTNKKFYSEHAGFLNFENAILQKIVVSGQTDRIDIDDDEIFLPQNMDEMLEYEYIFHTHPPTPKPGARANEGVLYEVPSIGDIFHFIDHYNDGNVIGSLVVTPEGLYNIRRHDLNEGHDVKKKKKMIDVNEDNMYNEYRKTFSKMQNDAIKEYGLKFTEHEFYSIIAQNTKYINMLNNKLNKYEINIDYYPRKNDSLKNWYIDTVFLNFVK